jgi:hypothetical protein
MPVITKSGRDPHASPPPAPLPQLDDTMPDQGCSMIAALAQNQAALTSPTIRTVVLYLAADGKVGLKITHDIPS